MKVNAKNIFIVLFFSVFLLSFVFAGIEQDLTQKLDTAENSLNAANQLANSKDARSDYLKTAWEKVLINEPVIGEIIVGYKFVYPYVNPVIEFLIGTPLAISLFFILSLIIWIMLVRAFFVFYEALRDFSTFSDTAAKVISAGFFVILLVLKFFQTFTALLANLITKAIVTIFTNRWGIILGWAIFIFAVVVLTRYMKFFRNWFRRVKENSDEKNKKMQEDADRKIIHAEAEELDKIFKK